MGYTSAAPWDPIFWVIHTTAERMLQYKRLLAYYGMFELEPQWGYEDGAAPSDIGVICDWSDVDGDVNVLPNCVKGTCEGHRAYDVLPWDFSDLSPGMDAPTNMELYNFVGPISANLPYVYDDFHWGHCKDSIPDSNDVYKSLVDQGLIEG